MFYFVRQICNTQYRFKKNHLFISYQYENNYRFNVDNICINKTVHHSYPFLKYGIV